MELQTRSTKALSDVAERSLLRGKGKTQDKQVLEALKRSNETCLSPSLSFFSKGPLARDLARFPWHLATREVVERVFVLDRSGVAMALSMTKSVSLPGTGSKWICCHSRQACGRWVPRNLEG